MLTKTTTSRAHAVPCLLAIGGLDPGGGAGILADARAAQIAGAYACACVSLLTVQSTAGLVRSKPIDAGALSASLCEVLAHQRVDAFKVGALGSSAQVLAVTGVLKCHRHVPLVVDTPRKPSRGRASLIDAKGWTVLIEHLLPMSTVLTVNADEAGWVLGRTVHTLDDAKAAARELAILGPRVVVVKGGHLEGNATDVIAFGARLTEVKDRRVRVGPLHGTGCTFASLIAGRLAARRVSVDDEAGQVAAIRWAKGAMRTLIRRPLNVGGPARVLG